MKHNILVAIVMVCTLAAFAQQPPQRGMGRHKGQSEFQNRNTKNPAMMAEKLNLTEAQKQQVKSLNESFR